MKCINKILVVAFVLIGQSGYSQCDSQLIEQYHKDSKTKKEIYLNNFPVFINGDSEEQRHVIGLIKRNWYRFYFYLSDKYDGKGRVEITPGGNTVLKYDLYPEMELCMVDIKCNKDQSYEIKFIKESGNEMCAEAILVSLGKLNKEEHEEKVQEIVKEEVFMIVDEMPVFKSGKRDLRAFREWVQSELRYPEEAAKNGIEGRVFVQFVVSQTGKVSDVKIVRGVDPLLNEEAKRVVENSPVWYKPGKQRGVPVNVQFTFPIVFGLK